MKNCLTIVTIVLLSTFTTVFGAEAAPKPQDKITEVSSDIRLNSLGYLPAANKQVTIISECSDFVVKSAVDDNAVYSNKVSGPFHQEDVNQAVWIADFSKVNKPGKYYLDVSGVGRSYDFEIGDKVYNFALYSSMRAFYLWRCGTAVEGEFNGNRFAHAACHTDDAWQDYIGEPNSTRLGEGDTGAKEGIKTPSRSRRRDGTGGWHDAGDYNKYVVNAGVTVGTLFLAWDHFQDNLKDLSLDIPDTAPGYPDFLKEIKWEIDWLFKMQYPDGSGRVSHKITRLNFSGFIMPEKDLEKRYFTDWSSAATADFVAMMAMAARYFKPYDAQYAQTCLEAATNSYAFLKSNPDNKSPDQRAFRTGGYYTRDPDDRLWAAAEMWETTGGAEYLKDFEERASRYDDKIDENWDWPEVKNLGMFTYLLSERKGKNTTILEDVRRDLLSTTNAIIAKGNKDVYGRPLGDRYYWGCNGTVARQTLTLMVANKVSPNPDYVNTALDAIGHLFGRNYYGRSYITGLGHQPPMNPHDRRSGADGITEPWPGYIVGGGHSARDWQDITRSASTNEIAINWQAALVYTLAGFISSETQ
jgi:endoglucanase